MKEVKKEFRKQHNEELLIIKSALNNIRVIKTRRISRTGRVDTEGNWRNAYRNLMGATER